MGITIILLTVLEGKISALDSMQEDVPSVVDANSNIGVGSVENSVMALTTVEEPLTKIILTGRISMTSMIDNMTEKGTRSATTIVMIKAEVGAWRLLLKFCWGF